MSELSADPGGRHVFSMRSFHQCYEVVVAVVVVAIAMVFVVARVLLVAASVILIVLAIGIVSIVREIGLVLVLVPLLALVLVMGFPTTPLYTPPPLGCPLKYTSIRLNYP